MMNIIVLGFDVGAKKTGVAIGQSLTSSARALHQLVCHAGIPVDVKQLRTLLTTWKPNVIIVGMPLRPDGKAQRATQQALDFIDCLKSHCDIPIQIIDEQLTTKSARAELFEAGGYRYLQKSDVDSYAAKLIVESWLAEQLGAH